MRMTSLARKHGASILFACSALLGVAGLAAGCMPDARPRPSSPSSSSGPVDTTTPGSVMTTPTTMFPSQSEPVPGPVAVGPACTGGMPGSAPASALPPGAGARGGLMPIIPSTITTASKPPLPISGGTLLTLADGVTVMASDPDRDQVYVVDLSTNNLRATIKLQAGDEPGRLVQDAAGRVHVALRRGGGLVALDPKTGTVTGRRDVCAAPRGVAYQATGDLVHVACASGELVSLPAAGGAATRSLTLENDLRDVVVDKMNRVLVSTFRKADVLVLAANGSVAERMHPGSGQVPSIMGPPQPTSPSVAWRMLPATNAAGGVIMLHQTGVDSEVDPFGAGYAGLKGCPGIVGTTVTAMTPGASAPPIAKGGLANVSLAVDVAVSPDGQTMALAVAGNSATQLATTVLVGATDQMTANTQNPCAFVGASAVTSGQAPTGEVVAVSFFLPTTTATESKVLAQTREPATLWRSDTGTSISLASDSLADTGHMIFHVNAGGGLACASCHPEGGEDGRVWNFTCTGARRTQSIRGGISQTAPFHWDGTETDFSRLMDDVFVQRMAGPQLASNQKTALQSWIDTIPALPKVRGLDAAAVARGQALFNDAKVACASCHAGTLLTNNTTIDVGTGLALQVPSLRGVSWRAPFMHNGCATTLGVRFSVAACGGGDKHGATATLTAPQLGDLTTYLQSL
jgi:outer membrane protein assembly factor BamB